MKTFALSAEEDFIVLTIPKSGTHLLQKLLYMISDKRAYQPRYFEGDLPFKADREPLPEELIEVYEATHWKNRWFLSHFNYSIFLKGFVKEYPLYKRIILIRDLRDIVVSYTNWRKPQIDEILGKDASFDDRLEWMINSGVPEYEYSMINIEKHAANALEWFDDPNTLVVRFEDLCGVKGGASERRQRKMILEIGRHLSIPISKIYLNYIVQNLWGNDVLKSKTFRNGKIGEWRDVFLPSHKKSFKKRLGKRLIELGYTKNMKW